LVNGEFWGRAARLDGRFLVAHGEERVVIVVLLHSLAIFLRALAPPRESFCFTDM